MTRPSKAAIEVVSMYQMIERNMESVITDFHHSTGLENETQALVDSAFIIFVSGMISAMNSQSNYNKNYVRVSAGKNEIIQ